MYLARPCTHALSAFALIVLRGLLRLRRGERGIALLVLSQFGIVSAKYSKLPSHSKAYVGWLLVRVVEDLAPWLAPLGGNLPCLSAVVRDEA